jgi:enolase-phosphatase E1
VTKAIVLDIEGTTSSTEFVTSTLFPYARARFARYFADHRDDPRVRRVLDQVRDEIGEPAAGEPRLVAALETWSDADVKITPLKTVQGWIWQDGFARGELVSHFFPDVIPALRHWHAGGITLAVFSSGSVDAQRAWFAHSPEGDLLPLIRRHFDTENAGPKREPASFRNIASALAFLPEAILFLSDIAGELDAAREAGLQTIGVRREGEPSYRTGVGDHREVSTFADIPAPVPSKLPR